MQPSTGREIVRLNLLSLRRTNGLHIELRAFHSGRDLCFEVIETALFDVYAKATLQLVQIAENTGRGRAGVDMVIYQPGVLLDLGVRGCPTLGVED